MRRVIGLIALLAIILGAVWLVQNRYDRVQSAGQTTPSEPTQSGDEAAPQPDIAAEAPAPVIEAPAPEAADEAIKTASAPVQAEPEASAVQSDVAAQPETPSAEIEIAAADPMAVDAPAVDAAPPVGIIPSFDIVRVEPSGETVIAGLAAPEASVEVLDGAEAIAVAEANERGEWALVVEAPLPPGTHDLAIRTTSPDKSEVTLSDQRIAVSVSEGRDEEPLVVLNTPELPSRVLQVPAETEAPVEIEVASAPEAVAGPEIVDAPVAEPEAAAETEAPAEIEVVSAPEAVAEPEIVEALAVEPEVAAEAEAPVEIEVASAPEAVAEPEIVETPTAEPEAAAEANTPAEVEVAAALEAAVAPMVEAESVSEPEIAQAPEAETPMTVVAAEDEAIVVASAGDQSEPLPREEPAPVAVAEEAPPAPVIVEEKPAPIEPMVGVAAVEAETNGALFIAGTATTPEPVRVYVDDDLIGETTPTAGGTWLVETKRELAPDNYTIRADQVDAGTGSVVSRAEVPFLREIEVAVLKQTTSSSDGTSAEVSGSVAAPMTVIIKRGDNLWRISRSTYGKGLRYSTIYQANRDQIRNPDLIYPGQVFVLPTENTAWEAE